MLLAINANNTNVKFALFDDTDLRFQWRLSTDPARTSDEYAVWLSQLMQVRGIAPQAVTGAIIATVVPQALHELKLLCRSYFDCDPMVIGESGVALGVEILIERPEEAGADRLVNAVAGHRRYGGPLIIVDFGTGTTFDVIDERGGYVGGVIAPGVNLSMEALYQHAAMLPRIACERPRQVIGKTTVEAMRSGVFWGYVGLIEGMVARIREEYADPAMKVVVTGGLAPLFEGATEIFQEIDAELTMHGLAEIHRRNLS